MNWNIWSKIRPYRIIRDVILVELCAGFGGGIAGWIASAAGASDFPVSSSAIIGTFIMVPIGLSIVGAINPKNRWFHLAIVTALVFAESCLTSSFINLSTILFYLTFYVVGGLLSMLYRVFRNREVDLMAVGGSTPNTPEQEVKK